MFDQEMKRMVKENKASEKVLCESQETTNNLKNENRIPTTTNPDYDKKLLLLSTPLEFSA